MNRREVIRWAGLSSAAVLLNLNPFGNRVRLPAAVEAGGTLYRGTRDGYIHVSQDGGQTWNLHSRFGPQMVFKGISKDSDGRVTLHMEYQGWPVRLALVKSGPFWETV